MRFPAPDAGYASFPAPDRASAAFPGPDVGVVAFPPPPIPQRDALATMDGLASAVWVIVPNRDAVVSMGGVASVSVVGVVEIDAVAVMNGVADAFRNIDAPVSMNGVASAVVAPVTFVDAVVSMDATAGIAGEVTAIVTAQVVTVMDAAASIAVEGFVTAPATMNGAASVVVAPLTSVNAVASMNGIASAQSVVVHGVLMGMDKSGTQSVPNDAWTLITGWATRSGFPDTVIASNGLQLTAGTYDLSAALKVNTSVEMTLRIYRGTTIVATTGPLTNITSITAFAEDVAVNEGEIITIQLYSELGRTVQAGSTNTYLTATPV